MEKVWRWKVWCSCDKPVHQCVSVLHGEEACSCEFSVAHFTSQCFCFLHVCVSDKHGYKSQTVYKDGQQKEAGAEGKASRNREAEDVRNENS